MAPKTIKHMDELIATKSESFIATVMGNKRFISDNRGAPFLGVLRGREKGRDL